MKVCMLSLTCCAGCFLSFLSGGKDLFDFLTKDVEVVFSPTFVDTKEIPRVDVAIVEGGVRTEADEELLREIRAKSTTLVAIGICATCMHARSIVRHDCLGFLRAFGHESSFEYVNGT